MKPITQALFLATVMILPYPKVMFSGWAQILLQSNHLRPLRVLKCTSCSSTIDEYKNTINQAVQSSSDRTSSARAAPDEPVLPESTASSAALAVPKLGKTSVPIPAFD